MNINWINFKSKSYVMLNLCVLPVNRHWYNKLQDASRLTSTSKHPNTHVLLSFEDCVLERNELVHYGIFIAAKHRFPKDYLHGIFFFFFHLIFESEYGHLFCLRLCSSLGMLLGTDLSIQSWGGGQVERESEQAEMWTNKWG